MRIVGITGGITSGKSAVTRYLKKHGFYVIDCDKITDALYENSDEFNQGLLNLFGNKIIYDGKISRSKLGSIVFSNKSEMKKLNNFAFPYILRQIEYEMECNKDLDIIFIDAPTLFESGLNKIIPFTDIWVVSVSVTTQMLRLKRRKSYLSANAINNILNSQWKDEERRNYATFVLNNDKGLPRLLFTRIKYGLELLGYTV